MAYNRNRGFELVELFEAEGKRTFTIEEAARRLQTNRANTLAIIGNLRRAKRVIALTKGLYALWHPSERKWGIHPLPVLDALMSFRKSPYYVGLLSAADNYGAAHQKPQRLQVLIPKQLNFRRAQGLALSFHVNKSFPKVGIGMLKTPSGGVAISSPELTALDLFYFESACGGFGNICLVIRDIISKLNKENLKVVADSYPHPSSVQRLGYLLERLNADTVLLNILKKWADGASLSPVALTSSYPKKGPVHSRWRIVENASVEVER